MASARENTSVHTNAVFSPTRLKLPSKPINTTSLIPKPIPMQSSDLPMYSALDQSQILLSPQFKRLKCTDDPMVVPSSSLSNLFPTNQIQVGIKTNDVSSLASFVGPSTIKTRAIQYTLPQLPTLRSAKNKRAKWDTKVFVILIAIRDYLMMPWKISKRTKRNMRNWPCNTKRPSIDVHLTF